MHRCFGVSGCLVGRGKWEKMPVRVPGLKRRMAGGTSAIAPAGSKQAWKPAIRLAPPPPPYRRFPNLLPTTNHSFVQCALWALWAAFEPAVPPVSGHCQCPRIAYT
jgi:hypothetical protein